MSGVWVAHLSNVGPQSKCVIPPFFKITREEFQDSLFLDSVQSFKLLILKHQASRQLNSDKSVPMWCIILRFIQKSETCFIVCFVTYKLDFRAVCLDLHWQHSRLYLYCSSVGNQTMTGRESRETGLEFSRHTWSIILTLTECKNSFITNQAVIE